VLFGVDDSEVLCVEQKPRDDRLALAGAVRALKARRGRTLTRPSALALLLAAGGDWPVRSPKHRKRDASFRCSALSCIRCSMASQSWLSSAR